MEEYILGAKRCARSLLECFFQASDELLLKDALDKLSLFCEPLSHMTQCDALFCLPEEALSLVCLSSVVDLEGIDGRGGPSLSICRGGR